MTTLMRRDRRSENPRWATRGKSACFWLGPISGSHQGQQPQRLHRNRGNPPSENKPNTWLHPTQSRIVRFLLHRGRRPYMAHLGPTRLPAATAAKTKRNGALRSDLQRSHTRRSRWSEGRGPRGLRTKARAGLRTGHACHRRWTAYGKWRRRPDEFVVSPWARST